MLKHNYCTCSLKSLPARNLIQFESNSKKPDRITQLAQKETVPSIKLPNGVRVPHFFILIFANKPNGNRLTFHNWKRSATVQHSFPLGSMETDVSPQRSIAEGVRPFDRVACHFKMEGTAMAAGFAVLGLLTFVFIVRNRALTFRKKLLSGIGASLCLLSVALDLAFIVYATHDCCHMFDQLH